MNRVKRHFEDEAGQFDSLILKLIPFYAEMVEALVRSVPCDEKEAIRVVDLGSGTGTVAWHVLKRFPLAQVTCVDFAESMLEAARAKLSSFKNVRYVAADFRDAGLDLGCDAVVSSLALHHLPSDADKRAFYGKIFDSLNPGGCFYNADMVLAANDRLQRLYLEKWKAFMKKSIPEEEIEKVWMKKYADEDRPAVWTAQCRWLSDIGFADVDVVWKYYNFAVFGGVKKSS
jgi:tRNA (cmo5U34)-methyltransferase